MNSRVFQVAGLAIALTAGSSWAAEQKPATTTPAAKAVAKERTMKLEERPVDVIIHQSLELGCDIHQAFREFTESDLLATWLGDKAEVEAKLGGKYHVFWDPKQIANHGTLGCRITAFVADRLLAFQWRGPDCFDDSMNRADPLTHVTLAFAPCSRKTDKACTHVELVHSGWGHGEEWDKARAFFERAWQMAFTRLSKKWPVASQ